MVPCAMKGWGQGYTCVGTMRKGMVALLSGMLWGGLVLWGQTVAFTFDDGPKLGETPLLSPQARNQALLETLRRHQVRAALFVTLNKGADCPEGMALLEAWSRGGHIVANHTVTHPDLNNPMVSLGQYRAKFWPVRRGSAPWRAGDPGFATPFCARAIPRRSGMA